MASQLQKISALYCAFFDRAPDKSGLDYWNAAMTDNGGDLRAIAQSFASHPVFASTYGAMNNQAFVEAIYKNMLGSAGDEHGIAYWVSQLDTGAARADVVESFLTSALEADLQAGLADGKLSQAEYDQAVVRQAYLANRADVGLHFAEQFGTHANITSDAVETDRAYIAAYSVIANVDGTASSKTISQNIIDAAIGAGTDDPMALLDALSGITVDGLVKGATVFIDANNNGVLDAGELSTKTDDWGHWSFRNTGTNPHAFNGQIVSIGGTDISTNNPVHGSLIAPPGARVVNALTTVIQIVATTNKLSAADAEMLVKSRLNISPAVHLQTFDAIAETSKSGTDAAAKATAVKIQSQVVEINLVLGEIGALLTGSGVSANKDDGVDAATRALANFIAGSNAVIDLAAITTAKQLITDATTIAGASASQMANVSSLSSDAAQAIANLSHAIQDAGANPSGSDGKTVLIEIAKVQLVAGAIEQSVENGAKGNDVSAAMIATTGSMFTTAIADAASQIGDVDGDNISDAPVTPPVVTPPPGDSVPPMIAAVTSSTADGSYIAGDTISIQVSFNEAVNVVTSGGTPTLLLETGSTDNTATYASGSGTNTLTFTYVVQAGDTSADLDFQSSTALALNGGTIKDIAGNAATLTLASPAAAGSLGANKNIVIDTTAPTTTISTVAFSQDTGTSSTDFNTKTAAQTISGTTSANMVSDEIVEVSIDNGSTWITATTSVGANTWSLAGVTLTASDTLKVRVTDAAGNTGTAASQAYVLDTVAPTTTIATMAFSADTGSSSTDFNTRTAAQTISGTTSANIAAGEIVEVSTDSGSTWITATTSVGANTWSLAGVTLTTSDTLKMRVADTAGNSGTVASQAYVLDTAAPTTTIATMGFSADTGSSSTDFTTKTAAQTISGTTSANIASGEIVEVSVDNGGTWTTATTSVGANTWSLAGVTLTASDTLKVRVTDAAGNTGTAASQAYVLDTVAPTTAIATMAFSVDTGASNTDFNTAIAAQTISGTTSANIASGEIVEVSIDNGNTWTTATTSVGANTWALAGVTLTASDTLKVRVTDTAGNSGTVASQAYVLDTTSQALTFTLTAGNDTVPGSTLDDTINGTVAGAFAAADSIDGAGGNDTLNVTDSANIDTTGTTVVNVETASLTSSGTVNAGTTGWTGLTSLAVSAAGAMTVNSGTTALNISETGAGQLTSDIVVDGGTSVSVASTHQGTGRITIGGTTAPTSAVTVTSSVDAGQSGGAITVNGGTTVSVTQSSTHATGTTVTSESAVTVNGGALTTTVTVSQPSVVAAASAVTGVTGVSAISAVTAAPGTQAVTARTAVPAVSAVTAVAGVAANGAVTIVDSMYNTATPNTISSVILASYGAGSAIRTNALTALSLSGTGGTLAITNATNGVGAVPSANPTLALTVNGLSGTNTITDTNNEIATLNVTATGADSTLAAFADTGLTTLTVAGTQVFRLNTMNSSLTSITVSGAAGFNDGGTTASGGFAARGAAATLTTTSNGAINVSIDATTQSFVGSTGVDTIRISSRVDATQTVTGGSSSSDELILEGGAYALTAATGLKVTGFETLGVAANVTGTIDMSNLASGFTKLHIIGNSNVAFTKVANNMNLQLDKASTQMTMVMADSTGPADTANVSLGSATSDSVNFGTLIFKDASAVGLGTLNIVSNGVDITPGDAVANFNTMVITDNGLSNLNVSGTQGLKITTIAQATTQATSFTLNNTDTGSFGVNIGTLTDSKLNSLNFSGTGLSKITTLSASGVATLAIDNSGTQMATVTTMSSTATLTSLTLTGNVQIGDGLVGGTGMTFTSQAGLTISGATDPAHVKITMAGAGSGKTDNITLGNGNNTFTDVSTAGTINLTVGTGSNYITLGGATTNSTGAYNITLGTHTAGTGPDYITVGTGGTAYATTPNFVITGAVTGDRITFSADGASSSNAPTLATAGATAADTIAAVEAAAAAAHRVAYAVFNGNTYIAESNTGTLATTDTTIVELIGTHTLTASTGYLTIAS
jgi:hypothetical protein